MGQEIHQAKAGPASCVLLIITTSTIIGPPRVAMALAPLLALIHDVLITIGVYSALRVRGHPRPRSSRPHHPRLLALRQHRACSTRSTRTRSASWASSPGMTYSDLVNLLDRTRCCMRSINTTIAGGADPGDLAARSVGLVGSGSTTLQDFAMALLIGLLAPARATRPAVQLADAARRSLGEAQGRDRWPAGSRRAASGGTAAAASGATRGPCVPASSDGGVDRRHASSPPGPATWPVRRTRRSSGSARRPTRRRQEGARHARHRRPARRPRGRALATLHASTGTLRRRPPGAHPARRPRLPASRGSCSRTSRPLLADPEPPSSTRRRHRRPLRRRRRRRGGRHRGPRASSSAAPVAYRHRGGVHPGAQARQAAVGRGARRSYQPGVRLATSWRSTATAMLPPASGCCSSTTCWPPGAPRRRPCRLVGRRWAAHGGRPGLPASSSAALGRAEAWAGSVGDRGSWSRA